MGNHGCTVAPLKYNFHCTGLSWEICFEGGLTELAEEQFAMQQGFAQHCSGQP
jgi:hypothetical protein